jgi:hypothetical protein
VRNETNLIDRERWKPGETLIPRSIGAVVRLAVLIAALGVAALMAVVVLLHVTEVIP